MKVYRIQHTDCKVNAGHGCVQFTYGCPVSNRFGFGYIGEPPLHIPWHKVCGVTAEQFSHWWNCNIESWHIPEGWNFLEFDMPDDMDAWHIDHGQIVFDRDLALSVREVTLDEMRSLILASV